MNEQHSVVVGKSGSGFWVRIKRHGIIFLFFQDWRIDFLIIRVRLCVWVGFVEDGVEL